MITIYFDGLCQPVNPDGIATYGFVIYQNGKPIKEGYGVIGEGKGMTNNVAEYTALKKAIEWLDRENINIRDKNKILIRGDSKLVINQLKGVWKVKSHTSKRFVPQIKELLKDKEVEFEWIPREKNEEADNLSRVAYDEYRAGKRGRGLS